MKLLQTTKIPDLYIITLAKFKDERGFFQETFNKTWYPGLVPTDYVQDNESFSKKGVLRGLHFQKTPCAQGKLVRVIQGKVQDIVIDLREKSPTFKKFLSIILDGTKIMYVPPGFAHGFLALEDSYFNYKCTSPYLKEAESGVIWNDTDLNLPWQISSPPIISEKDQSLPTLKQVLAQPKLRHC